MTPYILIWVLHWNGGSYSGSAEFNSQETCVAAGRLMADKVSFYNLKWRTELIECVKK